MTPSRRTCAEETRTNRAQRYAQNHEERESLFQHHEYGSAGQHIEHRQESRRQRKHQNILHRPRSVEKRDMISPVGVLAK